MLHYQKIFREQPDVISERTSGHWRGYDQGTAFRLLKLTTILTRYGVSPPIVLPAHCL